jgi:hypothetical protein
MDSDAIADANSFDVSGTSVAILQGFLNTTAVVSIEEAIEMLRPYCPNCSVQVALDTLVANKWEVAQIVIIGFDNEDYKCAIRIYTAEEPFPFYKWTNAPFFSKVAVCGLGAFINSICRLTRLNSAEARSRSVGTRLTSSCCSSLYKNSWRCRSLLTKASGTRRAYRRDFS